MACEGVVVRPVIAAAAVLLVAALGDLFVEFLGGSGLFGVHYVDVGHQALGVPLNADALLLVVLAIWSLLERRGRICMVPSLRHARKLAQRSSALDTLIVGVCAFATALGIEHVEQWLGGSKPFGGLPLLSVGGTVALLLFLALAALAIALMHRFLQALVLALETIARYIETTICDPVQRQNAAPMWTPQACSIVTCSASVLVAQCFGDRAPPRRFRLT